MTRVVIVDLDGTLYNTVHRSHFAQAGMWDKFHEHSSFDMPHADVVDLVKMLGADPEVKLVGCTGRNEQWREITLKWLSHWGVPLEDLLMRPDGNYNSDAEVKLSLMHTWLHENGLLMKNVWFALEDRDKMVDAWRSAGVPCYQVRPGEY